MKHNSAVTEFRLFLSNHFSTCRVQFSDIVRAVQTTFPALCDDRKLCIHEYPHRPEWRHELRHALDYMKRRKLVSQQRRGEYIFP